jgi:hypothetical protein
MLSGTAGTVATRLLHVPLLVAARGFTRHHNQRLETSGFGLLSSSLPSLAGGDKQRHLHSKGNATNKQLCLVLDLFKAFCSLFLSVRFFLFLLHLPQCGV